MNLKILSAFLALLGVVFPWVGQAGTDKDLANAPTNCTQRPISDFLDGQGSTVTFFPPIEDILGWLTPIADLPEGTFALIDYAGFANAYLIDTVGIDLGTKFNGRVLECPSDDGRSKISVVLNTRKALGFAQSAEDLIDSGFDFLNTPTIFGNKAQDTESGSGVVSGADPALGPATLRTTFYIDNPGDPLPDIRPAFQDNTPDVRPITIDFRSTTVGTLPDGTRARLRVQQVGATDTNGSLVFSREIVDINKLGRDD